MTESRSGIVSQSEKVPRSGWTWGLGGSLFASLCCLGPAVAALVGIGSASFLLGLARYRLPLLLVGLALAALGLVRALRRSRQTCSLDQHRRHLWLFPTVTLVTFALTYGILTYLVPTAVYNSLGASGAAASPASPIPTEERATEQPGGLLPVEVQGPATSTPTATDLRRVTLAISGMT